MTNLRPKRDRELIAACDHIRVNMLGVEFGLNNAVDIQPLLIQSQTVTEIATTRFTVRCPG